MTSRKSVVLLASALILVIGGSLYFLAAMTRQGSRSGDQAAMSCDMGISAAKGNRETTSVAPQQAVTLAASRTANEAGRGNRSVPPGPAPEGMVWIPGGEFWMGADEFPDAQPWHQVLVNGFWMDKTEVTNEQFETFVQATKYVTVAERTPRAEDFPGAPPENLVAGSVVFSPPDHPVKLNDHFQWWRYVN